MTLSATTRFHDPALSPVSPTTHTPLVSAPPPPTNQVVAFTSHADPTSATLEAILTAHPELRAQLPEHCETPTAKLLYIVTHRELAAMLGNKRVELRIGEHDVIRREANGSLSLISANSAPLVLNNVHGDLGRLLDAANRHAPPGEVSPYVLAEFTSLNDLLATAVHRAYADPTFDGGGAAPNQRGDALFTYATIQQVLVSEDPSQRGIECLASASFHLYKSMGLIPPELTREELEHRYTSIHGDADPATPRVKAAFNRSLRGFPVRHEGEQFFGVEATVAFANTLRSDDWAKLTGAAAGRYSLKQLPSIDEVVTHFANGGSGVRAQWADGGHYFVLTGARLTEHGLVVNQDDSLRSQAAVRRSLGQEPYLKYFTEAAHTKFWTMVRSPPATNQPRSANSS